MKNLNLKGDKALALIVGLLYGYRGMPFEVKVFKREEFSKDKHADDKVYFINRKSGQLTDRLEESTHICVIKEDKDLKKIVLFIYK
ncbi:hypothetical protein [Thermocrinis minervae]|uniref:Uncharacterized protein n=1 Tax=Thermocrinis minervae TaxID=381751 RepID=A0A1M6Q3T5_9AQUI|nr:hypothetical protein [Thermocrinis minervae]SHK14806.1 hypothetical protein SAMN05444391_0064 [Thermocrinis minervae]